MNNTKVRLKDRNIRWYLNDQAYQAYIYPRTGELSAEYDKMIESMLLMGIFQDEYPGTVVDYSIPMKTYKVKFSNGYSTWLEKRDLVYETKWEDENIQD